MSFHSLEDRLVKQALRAHRDAGRLGAVANRVMTATDAELAANPRAGAAKLRWAAKIDDRPAYYKADDDDAYDDAKNEEKTTP
jgi:16S rRNA (cytosine1402-N4)-methyltransferase